MSVKAWGSGTAADTAIVVESAAAFQALDAVYSAVLMRSYYGTALYRGGGLFQYVAGDTTTVDNGYCFDAPGGRYLRVFTDCLTSDDFGCLRDGSNQLTRVQALIDACINLRTRAVISASRSGAASAINCGGGTLYINLDGQQNVPGTDPPEHSEGQNGFGFSGEDRRFSQLNDVFISWGMAQGAGGGGSFGGGGTSTGSIRMENLSIEGCVAFWNCDTSPAVTNVRVDGTGVLPEFYNDLTYSFTGEIATNTLTVTTDNASAVISGSVAEDVLTVASVSSGAVAVGLYLVDSTTDNIVWITEQLTATTWQLSRSRDTALGTIRLLPNVVAVGKMIRGTGINYRVIGADADTAGTGYAVGDTITYSTGMATNLVLTVASIDDDGGVVDCTIQTTGQKASSLPTNPVTPTATSGAGTGATFDLYWNNRVRVLAMETGTGGLGTYTVEPAVTVAAGTSCQAYVDYDSCFIVLSSNHIKFTQCFAGRVTPLRNTPGYGCIMDGNSNPYVDGGQCNVNFGIYCGPNGWNLSTGGGNNCRFVGIHSEGLYGQFIEAFRTANLVVRENQARGPRIASVTGPIIKIGNTLTSHSTCSSPVIYDNVLDGKRETLSVVVALDDATAAVVAHNIISTSDIGISVDASSTIDEDASAVNTFISDVNTPWSRATNSERVPLPATLRPFITTTSNPNLDRRRDYILSITSTGDTVATPDAAPIEGEWYSFAVIKGSSGDSIGTWGTGWAHEGYAVGSGPSLVNMATTQYAAFFAKGMPGKGRYISAEAVASGGTGYAVNDTITISTGMSTNIVLTVTAVSGGVITAAVITNNGYRTSAAPSNPVSQDSTSGGGSGATFTLTWTTTFLVCTPPQVYVGTNPEDFLRGTAAAIGWSTRAKMTSSADGVLAMTNAAGSDFGRLQFGGTTSSFPALKRSSAILATRLADDSADAVHQATAFRTSTALITAVDGGATAAFTANMAGSTGGPTTAAQNGWVKMQDSSGATIWIPVWK